LIEDGPASVQQWFKDKGLTALVGLETDLFVPEGELAG